jgi:hypothetical protein
VLEDDLLYAMLQWMTEKIMQLEVEQKVPTTPGVLRGCLPVCRELVLRH